MKISSVSLYPNPNPNPNSNARVTTSKLFASSSSSSSFSSSSRTLSTFPTRLLPPLVSSSSPVRQLSNNSNDTQLPSQRDGSSYSSNEFNNFYSSHRSQSHEVSASSAAVNDEVGENGEKSIFHLPYSWERGSKDKDKDTWP